MLFLGYGVQKENDLDAAVIILDRQVVWSRYEHIRPVCLPPGGNIEKFVNRTATVSGWGVTKTGELSEVLRKTKLFVLPQEFCLDDSDSGSLFFNFTASMLCAIDAKFEDGGSMASCQGDSGGPLGKGLQKLHKPVSIS